eukprot:1864305-Pleurochrysis_carterae.AAC.1
MVLGVHLLKKVFQLHRRDFFLSCSILCFSSAASGVASHSIYGVLYFGTAFDCHSCWPHTRAEFEAADTVLKFFFAFFFVLAFLNLGLMWIEFMVSSQHATNVGSNLRRTAIVLYVVGGFWSTASIGLLSAYILVDSDYFTVWALSTIPFGAMCTVIYVVGGRAMRSIFLRACERSSQQAALLAVESPSTSAAETRKAERMRLRAQATQRAYFIAACLTPIYTSLALISEALKALHTFSSVEHIVRIALTFILYSVLSSMMYWLYNSLKIEQSAASCQDADDTTASSAVPEQSEQQGQPAQPVEPAQSVLKPAQLSMPWPEIPAPLMHPSCSADSASASCHRRETPVDRSVAIELQSTACAPSAHAETDVRVCIARGEAPSSDEESRPEGGQWSEEANGSYNGKYCA